MISIRPHSPQPEVDSPVAHLQACHRRIEERLQTLERAGVHLLDRTEEARQAIQTVFWFFDSSGANHTADEEESFFPRLTLRCTPEERQYLAVLQEEHARADRIYDRLKLIVAGMGHPPTAAEQVAYLDSARELAALYRQHIHREDARFPEIAERTLNGEDLAAIHAEMKQRRGL